MAWQASVMCLSVTRATGKCCVSVLPASFVTGASCIPFAWFLSRTQPAKYVQLQLAVAELVLYTAACHLQCMQE